MECSYCGGSVGSLSKTELLDGVLCSKCKKKLPKILQLQSKQLSVKETKKFIDSARKNAEIFEETSHFGNLYIDEIHNLLALSKSKNPTADNNIFNLFDLESIQTYCKNIKVDYSNKVYCSIEANLQFTSPNLSEVKYTLKDRQKCPTTRKGEYLDWELPGELSVFISIVNQALKNAVQKYNDEIENQFIKPKNFELFKAMCAFLLPNDYTRENLDRKYNKLLQICETSEEEQLINSYYQILNERLKGE